MTSKHETGECLTCGDHGRAEATHVFHTCPWSTPGFFPNCNACVIEMRRGIGKTLAFGWTLDTALAAARRTAEATPVWHFMSSPGVAECGADYANMCKTAIRVAVTCPACHRQMLGADAATFASEVERPDASTTCTGCLAPLGAHGITWEDNVYTCPQRPSDATPCPHCTATGRCGCETSGQWGKGPPEYKRAALHLASEWSEAYDDGRQDERDGLPPRVPPRRERATPPPNVTGLRDLLSEVIEEAMAPNDYDGTEGEDVFAVSRETLNRVVTARNALKEGT